MSPFSLQLAGSLLPLVAIASRVSLAANQTSLCQQVDSVFRIPAVWRTSLHSQTTILAKRET